MNNSPLRAVALGSFDGLHLGHMAVIDNIVNAKNFGLKPAALIFDEHPLKILSDCAPKKILQNKERDKILLSKGLEIIPISFSQIKNMSTDDFFKKIVVDTLNAGAVGCGPNYRFGKGNSGDSEELEYLCKKYGISCFVAPFIEYNSTPISSTAIRRAIEDGDIASADKMLGREFYYNSEVVTGAQRGRLIGVPTINQYFDKDFIVPKTGVYASLTEVDGKHYHSITNIGLRPTFENEDLRSETHIIDFCGDLYGKNISVKLLRFIRGETKFSNIDALKKQIELDIAISKGE